MRSDRKYFPSSLLHSQAHYSLHKYSTAVVQFSDLYMEKNEFVRMIN